jgi:ATP-binding cassette, subfamily B, bacterial HlyB/CyaB
LLLSRQTPELKNIALEKLKPIIPLLEPHYLNQGQLIPSSLSEQYLWLVRKGEIENQSGQKLVAGKIHFPSQSSSDKFWQVNEATELYSLSHDHGDLVQLSSPELKEFSPTVGVEKAIAPVKIEAIAPIDLSPSSTKTREQRIFSLFDPASRSSLAATNTPLSLSCPTKRHRLRGGLSDYGRTVLG